MYRILIILETVSLKVKYENQTVYAFCAARSGCVRGRVQSH